MIWSSRSASVARQRGGRLVHHDQPRVADERAQDLDLLLIGDAKRLDADGRAVLEADPGRELVEALALLGRGRRGPPRPSSIPRNTLSSTDIAGASASSWWMSAMPWRIASRGERKRHGLAVAEDLAGVGRDRAGDDLAERRLARAVLADERVDLAGGDGHG